MAIDTFALEHLHFGVSPHTILLVNWVTFSKALFLGSCLAELAFAEAPVLTGLVRRGGQIRGFFQTSDRQTAFALGVGGEWGGYRLISVDFDHRTAVVEEGDRRYVTHFGNSASESAVTPSSPVADIPNRPIFPFSLEEEEYRARNGQAAFVKLRNERLLRKIEGGSPSDNGVIHPEIIGDDGHP